MNRKYDLVLGAGGVKGYLHIGALRALEELRIPIGTVTGASVGAAVALMYTNGYDWKRLLEEFEKGHRRMFDPSVYTTALTTPDPVKLMVSRSLLSIEPLWKELCERDGLRANDRLQMVAHDVSNGEPYVFRGTDYDVWRGVAASGSAPDVFAPVRMGGRMLVDGALYHYNPTEFSKAPAIVFRLERATRWPLETLNPVDAYFHWRELYLPLIPTGNNYVDESKHILVSLPSPDVAGLSFGISDAKRAELVEVGYKTAYAVLSKAIADGRIVVPPAAK